MSAGCHRIEEDDDGNACGILRSPVESEEITSPYIYVYIHTYIHTHTHIYIYTHNEFFVS
jgi:hypothetical protein